MTLNKSIADPREEEPLSVDEAAERYRDRWILMRVTERDQDGFPVAGIVVSTGLTRESIQPVVMERVVHQRPAVQHFVFFGFRRTRSSEEWARMLRHATEEQHACDPQS